jgi:hypothetical protein
MRSLFHGTVRLALEVAQSPPSPGYEPKLIERGASPLTVVGVRVDDCARGEENSRRKKPISDRPRRDSPSNAITMISRKALAAVGASHQTIPPSYKPDFPRREWFPAASLRPNPKKYVPAFEEARGA